MFFSNFSIQVNPRCCKCGVTSYYLKDIYNTRWSDGTSSDLHIKWKINKAELQVIANDKTIIYGDVPLNAGVSFSGFVNGEDESVLKGEVLYTYNYSQYGNIGNYQIVPNGYESDNYNIVYKPGTLKVSPKELSFNWSSTREFRYDGKVKMITASIVGLVNNDDVKIASYEQNKAINIGNYVAKVKGITGTKKNNYTLEGATNISRKWSIVKAQESGKDNIDKGDTSDANKGDNISNRPPMNMYDKYAKDNDYKTDTEGAIEGVKVSNSEIQVDLGNGMMIIARGSFDNTLRLMIKKIKIKKKEWRWINSLTKNIGTNKGVYDIFFINSKGVKVNTGRGTKLSIMSREKLDKTDVFYIKSSGDRQKLKSVKEEYIVKFRMIQNGYYTLVMNDKSTTIEGNEQGVNVVGEGDKSDKKKDDKDNNTDKNKDNKGQDNKNQENTDLDGNDNVNDKTGEEDEQKRENDGNGNDDEEPDVITGEGESQEDSEYDFENDSKQQEKNEGINWFIIGGIILVIVTLLVIFLIVFKRKKRENE